ncbi:hypothetical protein B0H13DRAFT_2348795 [Mycena leptocephala]|nr:hypothetical protein B0H13DRAFT_2348795 [Mycena leptocephala]
MPPVRKHLIPLGPPFPSSSRRFSPQSRHRLGRAAPHVPSFIAFSVSQADADNDALAWAALSTTTTNDDNPGGWGTGVSWGTGTGWGTPTTDDNSGGWGNGGGWGDGVGTGWGNTAADSSSSTGAATTSTSS